MGRVLVIILVLLVLKSQAQTTEKSPPNWQNLDLKTDGVFGISTEKTYAELLKGKRPSPVIVAVIDGGVDVEHEDLKSVIWMNPKDGTHGRNFYSTMAKGDEEFDRAELASALQKYSKRFEGKDSSQVPVNQLPDFREYIRLKHTQTLSLKPLTDQLKAAQAGKKTLADILKKMGKPDPSIADFKSYVSVNAAEVEMQMELVRGLKVYAGYVDYKMLNLQRAIDYYGMQLAYYTKQDYDLNTGGPTAYHGTHISGIIAADRSNNLGIKGVANHVKIMVMRTIRAVNPEGEGMGGPGVPQLVGSEGTEQDKITAGSIRFAVDNGAKILNMSFGQFDNPSKILSEAFEYALNKEVLIVHASGNRGLDLDKKNIFPDRKAAEGKHLAAQWLEVGASGWKNDSTLVGRFSNYGKASVDVYAPGIEIYSTIPRSGYLMDTGTSMAAPVVSGLAALIWEYYPQYSAKQVKEIIMKSVNKTDFLTDKCISGGIVNAYEALKLAGSDQK